MSRRDGLQTTAPRTRSIRTWLGTGALAFLASACASGLAPEPRTEPTLSTVRIGGGEPIEFHTEADAGQMVVTAPISVVWTILPDVFEELGIPVNLSDRSVPEMGNNGFRTRRIEGKRLNTYLDCGFSMDGQVANIYDVTISVVARLEEVVEGSTVVTTIVDANAKPNATSGNSVHCTSRGVLEERIPVLALLKLGETVG